MLRTFCAEAEATPTSGCWACRKVQLLLGQYKQARDAVVLVEGVLDLLQTARAMHLLPGFQAFVPPQDRHLLQKHCTSPS